LDWLDRNIALSARLDALMVRVEAWLPRRDPEALSRVSADAVRTMQKLVPSTLIFLFGLTLWWNVATVPNSNAAMWPGVKWIVQILALDQYWGMFAPFPVKDDGWYVVDGLLRDSTPVDVMSPAQIRAPSYEVPELVSATFPNQRWRKYMMNIWAATNADHRLYFGRFLCRTWNHDDTTAPRQLVEFRINYMRRDTLPDYQPRKAVKVEIWHHKCF